MCEGAHGTCSPTFPPTLDSMTMYNDPCHVPIIVSVYIMPSKTCEPSHVSQHSSDTCPYVMFACTVYVLVRSFNLSEAVNVPVMSGTVVAPTVTSLCTYMDTGRMVDSA